MSKTLKAMRKIAMFWVVLFFTCTLSAQVMDQGNFVVGSLMGVSTANSKVSTGGVESKGLSAYQFSIAPNIGYFFADNLAAGLGVDFTRSRVQQPDQEETDDSDLLFGPFLRYYLPVDDQVALFLAANFGFGNSTDVQDIAGSRQSIQTNIFAAGVGPGFTIYAPSGLGLEAILKYNFARSKFDTEIGGVSASSTTRTNQFALSLGLQYYFGGVKPVAKRSSVY